jgi:hypothetical protein
MGRAHITGALEGDVVLKNLSITGCCLECTSYKDNLKISEKYKIDIDPERASNVDNFELEVECKWIHKGEYFCEIGFNVVKSPKGKHFQNYVDYLVYQNNMA